MKSESLLNEIEQNPHFRTLPDILCREGVDQIAFTAFFRDQLARLLLEHEDAHAGLKEESHHYILPAIAVYRSLQKYTSNRY